MAAKRYPDDLQGRRLPDLPGDGSPSYSVGLGAQSLSDEPTGVLLQLSRRIQRLEEENAYLQSQVQMLQEMCLLD